MTEPRPRTYRLTETEIEAIVNRSYEKHFEVFGAFSKEDIHKISHDWRRMQGLLGLQDKVALTIGKGILWVLGAGFAILAGVVAGVKTGLSGNG